MGQLEKLLDGTQGANLYQGGNFKGGTPASRPAVDPLNDLHSTGQPGSEHVHRNIGIDAGKDPKSFNYNNNPENLGPKSAAKFSAPTKYQNPEK